jgi:hypothetical protein
MGGTSVQQQRSDTNIDESVAVGMETRDDATIVLRTTTTM